MSVVSRTQALWQGEGCGDGAAAGGSGQGSEDKQGKANNRGPVLTRYTGHWLYLMLHFPLLKFCSSVDPKCWGY